MRIAVALAVAFALAACGGGGKKADPTLRNSGGGESGGDGDGARTNSGGDARVIQRTQMSGVIELSGDRGGAMEAAAKEMAAHCGPDNFTITQEGEEVVDGNTPTATAWRVHYQCSGPDAPPPP